MLLADMGKAFCAIHEKGCPRAANGFYAFFEEKSEIVTWPYLRVRFTGGKKRRADRKTAYAAKQLGLNGFQR